MTPPLVVDSRFANESALAEIAFALRATSDLRKVAVEVILQGSDTDDELAERAIELAGALVDRLVELGVERRRLEPVGAISSSAPAVNIVVTDRAPARR